MHIPTRVYLEVTYSMKGDYVKCLCSAGEIQSIFDMDKFSTHLVMNDTLGDGFNNRVKVSATFKVPSENIDTMGDDKAILKRFFESLKFPDYVEVNDIAVELGE